MAHTSKHITLLHKVNHVLQRVRVFKNWWLIVLPYTRLCTSSSRTMRLRTGQTIYLRNIFGADFYVTMEIFGRDDYGIRGIKLSETPTIIDMGANIGAFTLFVSHLFPQAKIFAFEPEHTNYKTLIKNINANAINARAFPVAIAKDDGMSWLSVDSADTASHTLTDIPNQKKQEIRTMSLASFIEQEHLEKIDLVKMDIEGAEYETLLNAGPALDKIDCLVLEIHDHPNYSQEDLLTFLNSRGFNVRRSPSRHNVFHATRTSS